MDQFIFLMEQYPVIKDIVAAMVLCRIVFKTVFTVAQKYVDFTVTKEDDKKLHKIMDSKYYKIAAFLVDLLASVKLPKLK
jgi:hypothetical protein